MSTSKPILNQSIKWLKSKPVSLQFGEGDATSNIDAEKGILKNVVMAQVGEAKGHGVHLEQDFIEDLVKYDNEKFANIGLKARFGHPGMSETAMGTQMGTFKNFKVVGDKAVADLHLLKSAELSPKNPGMGTWLMSMAAEKPDFVMSSIVFTMSNIYQYDEEGNQDHDPWQKDNDGEYVTDSWGYRKLKYPDKKIFVKLQDHHYTDIVEAGAATDSLFSTQFNKDKYAVAASQWLSEERPEILNFLKENPAKLLEFAEKCGIEIPREKYTISDKLKAAREYLFGKEYQPTIEEAEEFTPFDEKIHLTQEAHQEAIALATATHDENIETQKNTYEAKIAELNARIRELEKMPVDVDTSFETSQANAGSEKQLLTSWDHKLIAEQKSRKS